MASGERDGAAMNGRPLRIVHCVGFYFPESTGGTEVYVRDLVSELAAHSIEGAIVAATDGVPGRYLWHGTEVTRYRPDAVTQPAAPLDGTGADEAAAGRSVFQQIVAAANADIFHLHSWTTGAGLRHLQQVEQLGIPSVTTMHVASAICMRGTMLLEGKRPCDGRIDDTRCARCFALFRGLPSPAASLVSHLPRWDLTQTPIARLSSRAAALLSTRANIGRKAGQLHAMAELSSRIVTPSQWLCDALLANGIDRDKIVLSRQAASDAFARPDRPSRRTGDAALVIGYVGRIEVDKAPDLLLKAMAGVPAQVPVRLRVAGTGTNPNYSRLIAELAARDSRIEMVGLVEHAQVSTFLASLDVLAVPSRVMETGPLVVQEAQAMGIPVMGANIGGIAERVRDGIDGWVLQFDDPHPWTAAIIEAATKRDRVEQLSHNMQRTRSVADVASDMATVYRQIATEQTMEREAERDTPTALAEPIR
ncbi:glycosyltransferase family 4 protein [soil metagenome]